MAKKISLELEIGGVKKSVSNINDLEQAISDANKELKGLEIGSEAFNKLSGQIKRAKDTAEDLQESLKGQDLEKRVGAYAKVGSAIVSSFAAANAAIALFGEENEEVAKAAARAQSVLTIALTAREVAEGLVAVKTVAANIATAASAAAANAATTATRVLYTTLAANPYGAIVAAIGLVIGALALFGGETEKANNAVKEINATTSQEATELEYLAGRINDVNVGNELRAQTIEDLKKKYPGLNAFIDEENRLTAKGKELIDLKVEAMKIEAKIKAILNRITLEQQKILENQNADINEQITLFDELTAFFNGSAWVNASASYEVRQKKINDATSASSKAIKDLGEELKIATKELSDNAAKQEPFLKTMKQQVETDKNATDAKGNLIETQKKLAQAYQDGRKKVFEFSKEVELLTTALGNYDREIQRLGEIEISAKIIDDLKAIQQQRIELTKGLQGPIQQLNQSFKDLFEPPQDVFFERVFKDFSTELEKVLAGTSDFKSFNEVLLSFLEKNKDLNKEQTNALAGLTRGYEKFQEIFRKFGVEEAIKNLKGLTFGWAELDDETKKTYGTYQGVIALLADVGIELGIFKQELDDAGNLTDVVALDPKKAEENTKLFFDTIRKQVFKEAATTVALAKKQRLEAQIPLLPTITIEQQQIKKDLEGQLDELNQAIAKGLVPQQVLPDVEKFVDNYIKEFEKIFTAVFSKEQEVFKVAKTVQDLGKVLSEPPQVKGQSLLGFVVKNLQTVATESFNIKNKQQKDDEKFRDEALKDEAGFQEFVAVLREKYKGIELANIEDLKNAYVAYQKIVKDTTKETEDTKRAEFEKTLQEIQKYTQAFTQQINNIGSLFAQSFQAQQQFLKVSYDNTLKSIVGDTEQANQKRLELQEEYEAQTKELEKKATLTSLRFSLVQAVSNSAQAITRILAEFASNPAIAGILIGLTAVQTAAELAIINEQINTANMMRRGGLIKAQGGMLLSGPTHEQGGIPLAGMGVIAEGQEAIINRNSLINYRDLLSSVNQAGGGRPLVVNNFDDTRIVEAIASQRQKPLRAYVLESEITNEQALAKRLDSLSKI